MPGETIADPAATLTRELVRLRTEGRRAAPGDGPERLAVEEDIARLERALRALAQEPAGGTGDGIDLGWKVRVRREGAGAAREHVVVSPTEADPQRGLLALDSPLGRALLGHSAGETVTVNGPTGPFTVHIDAATPA